MNTFLLLIEESIKLWETTEASERSAIAISSPGLKSQIQLFFKSQILLYSSSKFNFFTLNPMKLNFLGCNLSCPTYVSYLQPGIGKSSMEYLVRIYAKDLRPKGIVQVGTPSSRDYCSSKFIHEDLSRNNNIVFSILFYDENCLSCRYYC